MRIEGPLKEKLLQEIERSFTLFELEQLLDFRLGVAMTAFTAPSRVVAQQVSDLVQYFNARFTTERLIAALRDARPAVPVFAEAADSAGFWTLPPRNQLQVLVTRNGSPYHDVEEFRAQLSLREAAVCKVRSQSGAGTGFLVGDDLVLTNHHVLAGVLQPDGTLSGRVDCDFDFKKSSEGYTTPIRAVKVSSVASSSAHAPEDLDPALNNISPTLLDYALLRLVDPVATEPIVKGGRPRGSISMVGARLAALNEGLLVLQHPEGGPMKLDIGAVIWTGATRMRHTVNTAPGSSGAPVFDGALNLVALHHAGYDWPTAEFPHNQSIPITLIRDHANLAGVAF